MGISGDQRAERQMFVGWLRTGRIPSPVVSSRTSLKFNPYHDPRNGQFTFAPGGGSPTHVRLDRPNAGRAESFRSPADIPPTRLTTSKVPAGNGAVIPNQSAPGGLFDDGIFQPSGSPMLLRVQAEERDPRLRIGGNSGSFLDPVTLQEAFPGLRSGAAGSVFAAADTLFDFTGPASEITTALTEGYSQHLIDQIRALEPGYTDPTFGTPITLGGQNVQIGRLRMDRAAAFYRVRNETRPLQVETIRFLQRAVDGKYAVALERLHKGLLPIRLSPQEALGNYVDREVRNELRDLFNARKIPFGRNMSVRVVGREHDTSGSEITYRVPDARIGNVAFDITLTRKTLATPQVRGFFNADFRPTQVVIIRPSQLGAGHTYVISRPRQQP